jgi:hypothetical protein
MERVNRVCAGRVTIHAQNKPFRRILHVPFRTFLPVIDG